MQAFVPGVVFALTGALLLALGIAGLLASDPPSGDARAAAQRPQLGASIAGIGLGALSAVAAVLSILSAL
jgi:hypothetical protein